MNAHALPPPAAPSEFTRSIEFGIEARGRHWVVVRATHFINRDVEKDVLTDDCSFHLSEAEAREAMPFVTAGQALRSATGREQADWFATASTEDIEAVLASGNSPVGATDQQDGVRR